MKGDRVVSGRDVTHKIMTIINQTMLEAMEAKKLNAPLKTKMTAAKAKSTVHDAVTRIKIILVPVSVSVSHAARLKVSTSSLTCFERG
jgi:DNA-binding transcriptional regulator YiaG